MKHSLLVAIIAVMATASYPHQAWAAQQTLTGASVCGRVTAPSATILSVVHPNLLVALPASNIIIARSSSEEVQTAVNLDGTYCFHNLHTDMHIISAFGDEEVNEAEYTARVLPVAGATVYTDLTRSLAI